MANTNLLSKKNMRDMNILEATLKMGIHKDIVLGEVEGVLKKIGGEGMRRLE